MSQKVFSNQQFDSIWAGNSPQPQRSMCPLVAMALHVADDRCRGAESGYGRVSGCPLGKCHAKPKQSRPQRQAHWIQARTSITRLLLAPRSRLSRTRDKCDIVKSRRCRESSSSFGFWLRMPRRLREFRNEKACLKVGQTDAHSNDGIGSWSFPDRSRRIPARLPVDSFRRFLRVDDG